MKKSNSLLIGYARVSKADAQDTVVQVKALTQARLQAHFRREGFRWSLGPARTSPGLGATQGRGRPGGLEAGPSLAIAEGSASHHGTGSGGQRRLSESHRGGGYDKRGRPHDDANVGKLC